jgi:hypothetical protein
MVGMKLTVRKHVRAPPRRNVVPTESHSNGQNVGYFPRTLWTVLLVLGSSEPPLFIGGNLRGAYDRSYPPHSPSGRGTYTEVDIRDRHERGSPRSIGGSTA